MADDSYGSLQDYLAARYPTQSAPARGMGAPSPPTGTGNLVTSALGSGVLTAGSQIASGVEGAARLVGADSLADAAAREAAAARANAATYARPDLEGSSMLSPRGLAYRVLQGLPGAVPAIGGMLIGGPAGAVAGAFPGAFGGGVQASEDYTGKPVTRGNAVKAALLGIPEAALGALPLGKAEAIMSRGVGSIGGVAASQAVVGAAQNFLGQQMGDPNRPLAQRAQDMLESALTGGATGALFGAGAHLLAKAPPRDVTNEQLAGAVDQDLGRAPPAGLLPPPAIPMGGPVEAPSERPYASTPTADLLQQAQAMKLRGDQAGLLDVAREFMARGILDKAGQPALPSPVRVGPSDISNEAEAPLMQSGAVETPPAPPIEGEVVGAPPLLEGPVQGLGSQEPIPQADRSALTPETIDRMIREETSNKMPGFLKGKTTETDVQNAIRQKWEDSGPNKITRALADKFGLLDENGDLRPAEPVEEPNRPTLDSIPEKHQARAQTLEDLRDQVGPEHTAAIDEAQSKLAAPKKGETAQVDQTIRQLQDIAKGKEAETALAKPAEEASAAEPVDRLADTKQAVFAAQNSLDALRSVDPAAGATDRSGKPIQPGGVKRLQKLWSQGLDEQQEKLNMVGRELAQGTPENLEGLPAGHFQSPLWDDYSQRLGPQARQALADHTEREQNIMDALDAAKQPNGALRANSFDFDRQVPADDKIGQDINYRIQQGASGQEILQHIALNGDSSMAKTTANLLLKTGVDPKVIYDTPAQGEQFQGLRGRAPSAAYDPTTNTAHIYNSGQLQHDVLHEATHAATMKALVAGGPAAREMQGLYDTVKRRSPGNDAYGLGDVFEFVSEAHANPTFQDFLREMPADPNVTNGGRVSNMWQAFKNVIGKLLGAKGQQQTMLDRVLETGSRLMKENQAAPEITRETPDTDRVPLRANAVDRDETAIRGFSQRLDGVRNVTAQQLKDEIDGRGLALKSGFRQMVLGWLTSDHIADWWSKWSPGVKTYVEGMRYKNLLNEANNKSNAAAATELHGLSDAARKTVNDLALGTMVGVDARKPWAAHTHLFDAKNAPELAKQHRQLSQAWAKLTPDEQIAYNSAIAANRANLHQRFAVGLYQLINADHAGKVPLPADPSEAHLQNTVAHDSPEMNEKFWEQSGRDLRTLAENYINAQKGEAAKGSAAAEGALKNLKPVQSLLDDYAAHVADMDRTPNFYAGHGTGGYFVTGKLAMDERGLPIAKNIEKFQAALNKAGFGDVSLDKNNENASVYTKVSSPIEMAKMRSVFDEMHAAGVLEQGSVSNGLSTEVASRKGVLPLWQQRAVEIMRQNLSGLGSEAEQHIADTIREYMNTLPDSSINRVMARREGVQGVHSDVLNNFKQRGTATARMLANLAAMPKIAQGAAQMREDVLAMNRSGASNNQKLSLSQAVHELILREGQSPAAQPNGFISAVRHAVHIMEVGLSPAYTFMLASQVGTLSLPELAKREGYMRSATALGRAVRDTFAVLREVARGEDGLNFGIRGETLDRAGLSDAKKALLLNLNNRGAFGESGYSQAMRGGHVDLSTSLGRAKAWGSAMGMYAEQMPRLLTAFAAHDLHGSSKNAQTRAESVYDYAHRMVESSQMNWDPTFNPRQVTSKGTFGAASPLINQFMGFQVRLGEKLYREAADAFGRNGPEQAAEARRFLAGHLAVITLLAGSLGAPMVGVFASVFDRLADWATNKDDWDVQASYRHYLAQTFGKEAGEVIARGVPRAFGVDLSHFGDEKIFPGSTALLMLTEKRKMEDAEKDWLKSEAGSAAGMFANMAFATRDLANGDYMRGLQKFVPEIARGPMEAAQLAMYGYRDRNGMKLPISSGARNIVLTALGLDPEDEAQYDEKKRILSGEMTLAQTREQNITSHLSLALSRGDMSNFRYWSGQSAEFARDHLGQLPPMAELGRLMERRYRSAAYANSVGAPINLSPRNIVGRGMVDF